MDYIDEEINLIWTVPAGYNLTDYVHLHINDGTPAGAVDWVTPESKRTWPVFPNEQGLVGFGYQTFGHFRFGHTEHRGNIGRGAMDITIEKTISEPGYYRIGVAAYDELGNQNPGTPEHDDIVIDLIPQKPDALIPTSYDSATNILVLTL